MTLTPYTCAVLRYTQDRGAGEMLNIGVVLYAPNSHELVFQLENRFQRLSEAFSGFDGEHYRKALARLQQALKQIADETQQRVLLDDQTGHTVIDLVRRAWTDDGLSFQFGPSLGGVTTDPQRELRLVFERMVSSRWDRHGR